MHVPMVKAFDLYKQKGARALYCRAAVPEDGQGGRRVQLVVQRGGAQRATAPGARRPRGGAVRPLVRSALETVSKEMRTQLQGSMCCTAHFTLCHAKLLSQCHIQTVVMCCLECMPLVLAGWLLCQCATNSNRAWWCRWVDRKGEIPEGKKPYYRLPVMNYYKVTAVA